jgi:hypothetical protein
MELDPVEQAQPTTSSGSTQFSLGSLLWLTVSLVLLFSYARWLGQSALHQAMIFTAMGTIVGLAMGMLFGRWQDTLFWALLVTLLAYLAMAGGRTNGMAVFYGWGLVGAFCGGMSTLARPKSHIWGAIWMGLAGSLVMLLTGICMRQALDQLFMFDVIAAAGIGAVLRPFLRFLQWFETQSHQHRFVLAAWLTISVLIGNFLVPVLGGVSR